MSPALVNLRMLPLLVALALVGLGPRADAQTFNSGSTGADGALNVTATQDGSPVTIPLPPSGVLNYTTINIPAGVTVKFVRNAANTPVTLLASGNVTIAGVIDISGGAGSINTSGTGTGVSGTVAQAFHTVPGTGGPGGYDGGGGGIVINLTGSVNGTAGDGPGGGGGGLGSADGSVLGDGGGGSFGTVGMAGNNTVLGATGAAADNGAAGATYGAASLLQLVGGSGGGGGGGYQSATGGSPIPGGSGGGGGGAIIIASSGTITFSTTGNYNDTIVASGGVGGSNSENGGIEIGGNGGGGAGGAVRVVATTITGTASVNVQGGQNYPGGIGGDGFPPRFEAYDFSNFDITIVSTTSLQPVYAAPSSVTLPSPPSLRITSVAGTAAPNVPNGSFHKAADITLPTTQTNPVAVGLQAANIPIGTAVTVEVSPEQGAQTFTQSTALAGTSATSTTASASVTLPTSLMSILYAAATINLVTAQPGVRPASVAHLLTATPAALPPPPLTLNGERVVRVEVTSTFGGEPQVVYITTSGKRYSRAQLLGK